MTGRILIYENEPRSLRPPVPVSNRALPTRGPTTNRYETRSTHPQHATTAPARPLQARRGADSCRGAVHDRPALVTDAGTPDGTRAVVWPHSSTDRVLLAAEPVRQHYRSNHGHRTEPTQRAVVHGIAPTFAAVCRPREPVPVNGPLGAYPQQHRSMALQKPTHHRDLAEHVHDRLGQHREVLEALAELDNELSADAQTALEILDELEGQE
jgi:hypothetical protein